ncbi:unnamed protein product [Closterium sp. NIES-65]|nr:unnamed protein product [Closterium sp. NIES-65]
MFFHVVLEKKLQLHPRHFGPHLREKLVSKLVAEVEGTCTGRHGFVVAVTTVESVGTGIVRDDTGYVTFPLIPDDMSFTPGDINSYQTEDGTVRCSATW